MPVKILLLDRAICSVNIVVYLFIIYILVDLLPDDFSISFGTAEKLYIVLIILVSFWASFISNSLLTRRKIGYAHAISLNITIIIWTTAKILIEFYYKNNGSFSGPYLSIFGNRLVGFVALLIILSIWHGRMARLAKGKGT